jgi:hypothetical protein
VKCERVDWYIFVFDRKIKLIYSTNTQQDAFLKIKNPILSSRLRLILYRTEGGRMLHRSVKNYQTTRYHVAEESNVPGHLKSHGIRTRSEKLFFISRHWILL